MDKIILDTSVLVKFFTPDEQDETVDDLLSRFIKKKLSFITLDFAIYELANTLKLSKKATVDVVSTNISDVLTMNFKIITYSEELIDSGLRFMDRFNLTIYDSLFISAAEMENLSLLTADYKHHRKEFSKHIILFEEWKI